jgi:hypothetical protein
VITAGVVIPLIGIFATLIGPERYQAAFEAETAPTHGA